MTNGEFIELAKALAWPAVVAGGLWYFREAIISILPRVRSLGPVTLDPASTPQTAGSSASAPNDLIMRIEASVSQELLDEGRKEIEKAFPDRSPDHLMTLAVGFLVGGQFERTYNIIFGSQIALLDRLNYGPPLSSEEAKVFMIELALFSPISTSHTHSKNG